MDKSATTATSNYKKAGPSSPATDANLKSRMDGLVALGGGGRRSNSSSIPKGYFFISGLALAAILSIYVSSSSSSGKDPTTQSLVLEEQQRYNQFFVPSRLDEQATEQNDMEDQDKEGKITKGHNERKSGTEQENSSPKNDNANDDVPIKMEKPMNIVLLYADDMRHDSLGIAGTQPVETPFLDWLSQNKAMRFTHNCVSTSVCWISRATLHSGVYFSRHQALRPRDSNWYDDYWESSYPSVLRKLGYYVTHIGKWHSADFGKISKTYHFSKIYYGKHWYPGNPRPIHTTERNERDGLETIRNRPKDKPFVLTLSFFAPHSWDGHADQYLPQNETMKRYKRLHLEPGFDMEDSFKRLPKFFSERNEGRYRYRMRFNEPEKYDKMLKNYYRLITEVDAACKSIWKELESQGILDETMVIFTTDNGYYHGEHGLAGKWYPHEESIRVPLIIYDPRMPPSKRGTTNDNFTLNIDLAPTILGAAYDAEKPKQYQGRDISDLYLRPGSPPWRQEFYYEHPIHINKNVIPASSALVRKDIKYVHWPDWSVEQLFNLTSDPKEEHDEISNPAYAELHAELKARHNELRSKVGKENTEL